MLSLKVCSCNRKRACWDYLLQFRISVSNWNKKDKIHCWKISHFLRECYCNQSI